MTASAALEVVGELIKAQRMRIEITAEVGYTVTAPCLLAQLAEAVEMGGESGGRGVPGSRPTIAVEALDLWVRIVTSTHAWADACGLSRRDSTPDSPTPWIGRLLRSATATAASTGKQEMVDRITTSARAWVREIRALLTGEVEQRGIRGAVCPDPVCGQMWVVEEREADGRRVEHYRIPAIVLIVEAILDDAVLRWLTCLACGWNRALSLDDATVLAHVSESLDTGLARAT